MIVTKTAKGTQVWVCVYNDCKPNQGGYYCEISLGEDDDPIDYFVIQSDDIIWTYTSVEDAVYDYVNNIVEY
jgi:hypothetical protein